MFAVEGPYKKLLSPLKSSPWFNLKAMCDFASEAFSVPLSARNIVRQPSYNNEAPWCKMLGRVPHGYKFVRMTIVRHVF